MLTLPTKESTMSANPSRTASELMAVGQMFRHYDGERHARDVLREGGGLADLHLRIGRSIQGSAGVRSWDRAAGVSVGERDLSRFSICGLVRALMSVAEAYAAPVPDQFDRNLDAERELLRNARNSRTFELEICHGIPSAAMMGGGTPLPWSALARDFNVGSASEAGNLVASGTKDLSLTPDAPRNALALAKLGALMPGGLRQSFSVPTITTDQTNVGYVAEVGAATEGQPVSGLVTFAPKRVTAYLEASKQFVIQGGPVADAVLSRTLLGKAYAVMEGAAINGDGTGDNPTGVRSTAGIGTVAGGANGAQLAWSHLLDLEHAPAVANAPEQFSGYLVNAKTRKWLKSTVRASNLPFMWDGGERPLNGHPAAVTNFVPGDLVKGSSGAVCSSLVYSSDWSTLMVPIFGVPDITVDPYSKATTGQVRIFLNIYMAAGVLMPSAFAKMDDALTA